jgi:hypothetical protein
MSLGDAITSLKSAVAELESLQQMLSGGSSASSSHSVSRKPASPTRTGQKRTLSAAARKRISDAAKKRWRAIKAAKG